MNEIDCPTCKHPMIKIGCRVSDLPIHYCVQCGTLKTCEAEEFVVPSWSDNKKYVDIVFTGPPGPKSGEFVEVEDETGKSINFGQWIKRTCGLWALRIPKSN
jgi:hypothetical protein